MEEWKLYIFVILSIAMGVTYTVRRYFKQQKYTDFNFRSQRNIKLSQENEDDKRFDFRKKRFEDLKDEKSLKEAPTSFRTAFSHKTKQSQSINNVELNKYFWYSLAFLVSIIIAIIFID